MGLTDAQMSVKAAAAALKDATAARDKVIADAYRSGATAIEIADQVGLARQQVHRIIANNPSPELRALRDQVTKEMHSVIYDEIMLGDRGNIDKEVDRWATFRGIAV